MNHRSGARFWIALWILVAVAVTGPSSGKAATFGDPRAMKIPALGEIQAPRPERYELPNGMVFFLLEDHDFPLVDARAAIRVGSIYEPADKVGLASMTGEILRSGGSTSAAGDALDELLESMGASVEVGIGETQGTATVSTLSKDFEAGIKILNDLLRHPAFPEDKLDLARKQERTAIASRNDDPQDVMFRQVRKLLYGAEHPYARTSEYATVDAITREDLVRFHGEYFHPDRIIMTVYGDFAPAQLKVLLGSTFGDWTRSTKSLPPDPEVRPNELNGKYLVEKKDMTNSGVLLAQIGMKMDDPDYPAMDVWNEILGGGFSSRLFNEIRTKRGLAYAAGSGLGAGYHHPGGMILFAMTRADSTVNTLGYVKRELDRLLNEPVSEDELQKAKDRLLNTLVFDFAGKGAVLNRMADYTYYGYPMDFLQRYQASVQKLTPSDLAAAAHRKVRPESMATLVVGNPEKFAADLPRLGEVTPIDITIPEPAETVIPPATEGDLKKGQDILASASKATGGTALASLKDYTLEESGSISFQGQEIPVSSKRVSRLPDCVRTEQKLPFGTMTMARCGEGGWIQTPGGVQDLPPDQLSESEADRMKDLAFLLGHYSELRAQALAEPATVEGKPSDVVYVMNDFVKGWKIYVDRESKLIVRMDYKDRGPEGGVVSAEEYLSDYRKVSGVLWPHARRVLHDGEPFVQMKTATFATNIGAADGLFAKPSD